MEGNIRIYVQDKSNPGVPGHRLSPRITVAVSGLTRILDRKEKAQ